MNTIDFIEIIVWIAITLGAGIYAGLRADTATFWVNRRSTGTARLIFTIASTQVGAGAILGIASATFSTGLGFGLVSLVSTVTGFLALAYLAPALKRFGDRHGAITLQEILRVRYSRTVEIVSSLVVLFTYISILAVQFLAASFLIALSTGWDIRLAIVLATLSCIVYSSIAGIKGDIVTDILHFWAKAIVFLMIVVPVLIIRHPFSGWVGLVPPQIWSPLTFGGWPFLSLGLILGFIVPLMQPELWIKIYASKSPPQSRKVLIVSSLAIIPFYLFAIYAGILGRTIYFGQLNPDLVVIRLLQDHLPIGLLGLGVAAIFSDIISTADTMIVVISGTIFRNLLQKDASSEHNLKISRATTAIVGIVGALMAISVPNLVQLLINAFYVLLVIGPALLGVRLWSRATAKGAVVSIISGAIAAGIFLFISPREAFLPGLLVSILSFIIVSLSTMHSLSEVREPASIF